MRQPHELPLSREQPFSTSSAQRSGVSRARLRRGDLVAPFHGTRQAAESPPVTLEARCRAYATVMPEGMCFSHTTAAILYGLPIPARFHEEVHVSAPLHRRAPRAAGIVGHRVTLDPSSIRRIRGLPLAAPADVFCQVARYLDHDALVRVGDALTRRKDPLATLLKLRVAVIAAEGRPGIRALREAVGSVRARTDSPMETSLRLALVRAGLPEPHVNYRTSIGSGRFAHLDLAYPVERVAIEYDGDQHRTDDRQFHIDGDRLWRIESHGWRIVRVNRSHMTDDGAEAVSRVRSALRSMGRNTPFSAG